MQEDVSLDIRNGMNFLYILSVKLYLKESAFLRELEKKLEGAHHQEIGVGKGLIV